MLIRLLLDTETRQLNLLKPAIFQIINATLMINIRLMALLSGGFIFISAQVLNAQQDQCRDILINGAMMHFNVKSQAELKSKLVDHFYNETSSSENRTQKSGVGISVVYEGVPIGANGNSQGATSQSAFQKLKTRHEANLDSNEMSALAIEMGDKTIINAWLSCMNQMNPSGAKVELVNPVESADIQAFVSWNHVVQDVDTNPKELILITTQNLKTVDAGGVIRGAKFKIDQARAIKLERIDNKRAGSLVIQFENRPLVFRIFPPTEASVPKEITALSQALDKMNQEGPKVPWAALNTGAVVDMVMKTQSRASDRRLIHDLENNLPLPGSGPFPPLPKLKLKHDLENADIGKWSPNGGQLEQNPIQAGEIKAILDFYAAVVDVSRQLAKVPNFPEKLNSELSMKTTLIYNHIEAWRLLEKCQTRDFGGMSYEQLPLPILDRFAMLIYVGNNPMPAVEFIGKTARATINSATK